MKKMPGSHLMRFDTLSNNFYWVPTKINIILQIILLGFIGKHTTFWHFITDASIRSIKVPIKHVPIESKILFAEHQQVGSTKT